MFEVDETSIWFYDVIGEDFMGISPEMVKRGLDQFDGADFNLRINSPGGEINDGVAIANMIRNYEGKVTAIVDSLAASMSSYIPMMADEIRMADNARMMIHAPMTLAFGNSQDMLDVATMLEKHDESMAKAYADRSGKSVEDIKAIFQSEEWFTAEEAVEAGFADEVIESKMEVEARVNNRIFGFKNIPEQYVGEKVAAFSGKVKPEEPEQPQGPDFQRIKKAKARIKLATV